MSDITLRDAIRAMKQAHDAYEAQCHVVWRSLRSEYPEVELTLNQCGFTEKSARPWFFNRIFDDRTKCGAELFADGRGQEVLDRILRMAHGMNA